MAGTIHGQAAPAASAPNQGANPNAPKEIIEQAKNAMPAPANGVLTTADGLGLRFYFHYAPPKNPNFNYAFNWASKSHLFSSIPEISGIDGLLVIPRPLHYVAMQCDTMNAFYSPKNSAIILCYEMIDYLQKIAKALSKDMDDPNTFITEFVRDNVRFIMLHETGHAFIHMLDIPAVGREEDSVDQLATVLLLLGLGGQSKHDIARVLQLASAWFAVNSKIRSTPTASNFADEHSLDEQRYFNILCIAYGTDPTEYQNLVKKERLPRARAERCPTEAEKIRRSWDRLLSPHASPYWNARMQEVANATPKKTQKKNSLEWDKKTNPFDD